MIKREELDELRALIFRGQPLFGPTGKALQFAYGLIEERDNLFKLAKALLMADIGNEKDVLAVLFSRLHGGSRDVNPKPKSPYDMESNR